ncbi:hypothetical protein ACROYT_G000803 [Oculina patagonica]
MFGKSSAVSLLLSLLAAPLFNQIEAGNDTISSSKNPNACLQGPPGLPGRECINGINRLSGRDGRDGVKGEKGAAGTPGLPGGLPGRNGINGHNGLPGRDGRDGVKGEKGVAGPAGSRGVKGDAGQNGAAADQKKLETDSEFTKNKDVTTLRVVYQGTIYLGGCSACCKRWFITFNGAECSGPLPIDVVLWIRNKDEDNHRPEAIEGYCDNIHKGKVRVGINIGNCPGYGNSDGNTGWKSASRLIIEEVPRSQ